MKKLLGVIILILIIVGIAIFFSKISKEFKKEEVSNINIDGKDISKEDILVLADKHFLIKLDELYANYKEHEGEYLQIEGFIFNDPESKKIIVGREYSCCGPDNFLIGLECEDIVEKYEDDTWVRATGKIKIFEDKENTFNPIIISLTDVTTEKISEGDRLVSY